MKTAALKIVALLLAIPVALFFCGMILFARHWAAHQEDHAPEQEEFMHPKEACL